MQNENPMAFNDIFIMDNFSKKGEHVYVPKYNSGHGGADSRLHEKIFRNPTGENPNKIMAGTGMVSCLVSSELLPAKVLP